ncbi:MAG: hypothetical protein LAP21_28305 [Acidobacteriia bacterium]|nr:hypothetical protein [Terriglobia bacterium]
MRFVEGARVRITYRGQTVEGEMLLSSDHRLSMALVFDADLGGYEGFMPVFRNHEEYFDLLRGEKVTITVIKPFLVR